MRGIATKKAKAERERERRHAANPPLTCGECGVSGAKGGERSHWLITPTLTICASCKPVRPQPTYVAPITGAGVWWCLCSIGNDGSIIVQSRKRAEDKRSAEALFAPYARRYFVASQASLAVSGKMPAPLPCKDCGQPTYGAECFVCSTTQGRMRKKRHFDATRRQALAGAQLGMAL